MIFYDIVPLQDILEEMKELCFSHAEETEAYKDEMPLDPNFSVYLDLSDQGSLRFVTARDESGKLVGYFSMIIENHPNHKSVKSCTNNLLYVKTSYRKSGVAKEMIQLAEEYLKEVGVELFLFSAKAHTPLKELAKDLGFDECEVSYSKIIKREK